MLYVFCSEAFYFWKFLPYDNEIASCLTFFLLSLQEILSGTLYFGKLAVSIEARSYFYYMKVQLLLVLIKCLNLEDLLRKVCNEGSFRFWSINPCAHFPLSLWLFVWVCSFLLRLFSCVYYSPGMVALFSLWQMFKT